MAAETAVLHLMEKPGQLSNVSDIKLEGYSVQMKEMFINLRNFPEFSSLELVSNVAGISNKAFLDLLNSLSHRKKSLFKLCLAACRCTNSEDLYPLFGDFRNFPALQVLNLSHMDEKGFEYLAEAVKCLPRLKECRVAKCGGTNISSTFKGNVGRFLSNITY